MRVKRLAMLATALALTVMVSACSQGSSTKSVDYGQGEVGQVTLSPSQESEGSTVLVDVPSWVTETQYDAYEDGSADEQISCSSDDIGILYALAGDDPETFVSYYLDQGNLEQLHLFADKFTDIRFGTVQHRDVNGLDVVWSWYSYRDEYGRANLYYVSAATVDDERSVEVSLSQIRLDKGEDVTIDESTLWEVWGGISLQER